MPGDRRLPHMALGSELHATMPNDWIEFCEVKKDGPCPGSNEIVSVSQQPDRKLHWTHLHDGGSIFISDDLPPLHSTCRRFTGRRHIREHFTVLTQRSKVRPMKALLCVFSCPISKETSISLHRDTLGGFLSDAPC